ncbi:MAG: DUF1405 domain-containing protein [Desulfotomaculales bacterium]
MIAELWRDFIRAPWQQKYMLPLLIINLGGSVYGYFWYRHQLAETPFYFWPLVSDSPFATTLFAFALLACLVTGGRGGWFSVLACVCCLKYGFWAVVLITHYWWAGNSRSFLEVLLWLSHWGMVLEGWFYLRPLVIRAGGVIFPVLFLLLNDFVDYKTGLHPYLFMENQLPLAIRTAVGLTVFLGAVLVARKFLSGRSPGRPAGV